MRDLIDNNLEFKLTLFAGLLGTWWWILDFASKFDLKKEGNFTTLSFFVVSFFVFYPLLNLLEILVYTFLYQRNGVADKKLEERYKNASSRFFSWLALLFLIFPLLLIIFVFAQTEVIISIAISILYLLVVGFFFARFFKFSDFGKYYWVFGAWFTGYVLVFFFVYAFARVFGKMNLI
jgi:hypothetical protein